MVSSYKRSSCQELLLSPSCLIETFASVDYNTCELISPDFLGHAKYFLRRRLPIHLWIQWMLIIQSPSRLVKVGRLNK